MGAGADGAGRGAGADRLANAALRAAALLSFLLIADVLGSFPTRLVGPEARRYDTPKFDTFSSFSLLFAPAKLDVGIIYKRPRKYVMRPPRLEMGMESYPKTCL
jgi:hypothetical protein